MPNEQCSRSKRAVKSARYRNNRMRTIFTTPYVIIIEIKSNIINKYAWNFIFINICMELNILRNILLCSLQIASKNKAKMNNFIT
uniref:Uncharacterized protein n=1 Tax=Ascaris lumbricoides TaxID=6252 RepID=A0A0M3HV54_ASCLU